MEHLLELSGFPNQLYTSQVSARATCIGIYPQLQLVTSNNTQVVDCCLLPWQLLFVPPKPFQDPSIDLFSAGKNQVSSAFPNLEFTLFPGI